EGAKALLGDRRQQGVPAGEVTVGRGVAYSHPASNLAQTQRSRALARHQLQSGVEQRPAQVAVMIGSFPCIARGRLLHCRSTPGGSLPDYMLTAPTLMCTLS